MQNGIQLGNGTLVNLDKALYVSKNHVVFDESHQLAITQNDYELILSLLLDPRLKKPLQVEVTTTSETVTFYEPKTDIAKRIELMYRDLLHIANKQHTEQWQFCAQILKKHNLL